MDIIYYVCKNIIYMNYLLLTFFIFPLNVQRKRDLQLTISKLISQMDSIFQELEYAKKIIDSIDYENDIIEQSISEL